MVIEMLEPFSKAVPVYAHRKHMSEPILITFSRLRHSFFILYSLILLFLHFISRAYKMQKK